MIEKFKKNKFLFEELVKRDFKKKYKRTVLGMLWSILSPLLSLLVMSIVFKNFFGNDLPHYTIYLFAGNLVFSFFRDSTSGGMASLMANANIITKINVPKYLFLMSKNISALINFGLTLLIFFLFTFIDGIMPTWRYIFLVFPTLCLIMFNVGVGFILSASYVIFKDTQYLYDIFILLLSYLSAIFYSTDTYSPLVQKIFYINPVYTYITYFREIVIYRQVPSLALHGLCLLYAAAAVFIGAMIYKKNNYKFLYYM